MTSHAAALLVVGALASGCAVGVATEGDAPGPRDAASDHATRLDGVVVADGAAPEDSGAPQDSGVAVADTGAPDSGLPALSCDPKFTAPKVASTAPFDVGFTDGVGWVYIGLDVSGAGAPKAQLTNITGSFTWHFHVTGQGVGKLRLIFTKDNGTKVAPCDLWVQ